MFNLDKYDTCQFVEKIVNIANKNQILAYIPGNADSAT